MLFQRCYGERRNLYFRELCREIDEENDTTITRNHEGTLAKRRYTVSQQEHDDILVQLITTR